MNISNPAFFVLEISGKCGFCYFPRFWELRAESFVSQYEK